MGLDQESKQGERAQTDAPGIAHTAETAKDSVVTEEDVAKIIRLRREQIVNSFVSVRGAAWQYQAEIAEQCLELLFKMQTILQCVTVIIWNNLEALPNNVISSFTMQYQRCLQFGRIPHDFNFRALSTAHFWAVVILSAKCAGELFACSTIGHACMVFVFGDGRLLAFFTYVNLPIYAFLLHRKIPLDILTNADRRFLVLALSFFIGSSTHFVLINWVQPQFPAPPCYSPAIVAIMLEFTGPLVAHDRRLLLMSTVGVAGIVCFAYGIVMDAFDFTYFYMSLIAILFSLKNLQLLLADTGRRNEIEGQIWLPVNSMYNQLAMTILLGAYVPGRDPREAIPDSTEEQYSLLIRLRH